MIKIKLIMDTIFYISMISFIMLTGCALQSQINNNMFDFYRYMSFALLFAMTSQATLLADKVAKTTS